VDRVVKAVAIVPARGGSRSLSRKNARLLLGHPLLAWSVAAARQAREVGRVIVSTDDAELREIALHYGAEAPFLRPPALAQDATPDLPVFEHALRWLAEHEGACPELVVQLRPTSPLRPPGLVDRGVRALRADPGAHSLRAVVPSTQNPYKTWRIEGDRLRPLFAAEPLPEPYNQPRQLLPATFWQTGHLDVARTAAMRERRSLTGSAVVPLLVDPAYAVDIDGIEQWEEAEELLSSGRLSCVTPDGAVPASPWAAVRMIVFDFDGVFTDNRVTVAADGTESVVCHRADGAGIAELREAGIAAAVLSAETSGVVAARCRKLALPFVQGVRDKGPAFAALVAQHGFRPQEVAYVGNDRADLPCFERAGLAVAVADALPEVRRAAHVVLSMAGGQGAVREACDALLAAVGRHAEEGTWARS
jgi:YrbI family 3-deoxy-D-manno-octulosonate 8-phosphate phosphatase